MSTSRFSIGNVVLVPFPFTDQSGTKKRPAVVVSSNTTGLLVLTQDGRIAKQLIGEDSEIEKEYLVRVAGPLGQGPASSEVSADDQLRFVLKEGKKRQIRRMCEAVGLKVLGLKRVRIGRVMLGDLPAGQWRYLRGDEVFG